jgi:DNA polymerase V
MAMGLFGISEDHSEDYLSLDERFIRNKNATFMFRMEGDSLAPMILNGDYLIIDRSIHHFQNKLLVLDYQGERLCRLMINLQGRKILRAFNPKFKDIVITMENELQIFGVVTMHFRDWLNVTF